MKFTWWWDKKNEQKQSIKPWETFTVLLHGEQAGDICDEEETMRILREAGYKIVRERGKRK